MLEIIGQTGKPVLLSSGMSSLQELDAAVALLRPYGNPMTLLQCTTAYPTIPQDWGLNVLALLKERYQLPVGFSDHSGDIYACLAASALGAEILEVHAVFDQRMFGPDATASLTIEQIKKLISGVRQVEQALHTPVDKSTNEQFQPLKQIFEKSLAVNKDLTIGQTLSVSDLEAKKPKGYGIPAYQFREVLGKPLKVSKKAWEFLNETDF